MFLALLSNSDANVGCTMSLWTRRYDTNLVGRPNNVLARHHSDHSPSYNQVHDRGNSSKVDGSSSNLPVVSSLHLPGPSNTVVGPVSHFGRLWGF